MYPREKPTFVYRQVIAECLCLWVFIITWHVMLDLDRDFQTSTIWFPLCPHFMTYSTKWFNCAYFKVHAKFPRDEVIMYNVTVHVQNVHLSNFV